MGNFNLLIIEDDLGDLKLTKHAVKISFKDVNIVDCNSADKALTFLTAENNSLDLPDLIILDLNLPKLCGLDFLKEVKTNEKLKHIPIVIFTNSNAKKDIRSAYENYASGYFRKPSEITEIIDVITIIINYWQNSLKY